MADTPAVDVALPRLLALLREAGVPFKVVGGLAVIHHGYVRLTRDIDVIVDSDARPRVDPLPEGCEFVWDRPSRMRDEPTGVLVYLLHSGAPLARRPEHVFPRPQDIEASPRDPDYIGLAPLIELKLLAGRRQDEADVVELLKRLDDAEYLRVEAAVARSSRPFLAQLRDEALDELRTDDRY